MVARADEAMLLCAPEREAHATPCFGRLLAQSQRRFEHYRRATTIVVDARPFWHAVEMRFSDNQGTIVRVGQHVSSEPLAGHGIDVEAHSGAATGCDFQ